MADRKDEAQLAREMQQRYRNVFGNEEGRIVLGDILLTLGHFGSNPIGKIQVAEHNLAVTIARMAGAMDGLYAELGIREE